MRLISIQEIRNQLKLAENPMFIFDDDADGICSFTLLHNYIDKGIPLITKGGGLLSDEKFAKKINDYSPDILFILDVPVVSQEFVDILKCKKIIWIDHHTPINLKRVYYQNPRVKHPKIYKPTSEICYSITKGEKWMAAVGIIGDYKIPSFFNSLKKDYKDLFKDFKSIEDVIFKSKFGELIRVVNYNLKGKSGDVKKFIGVYKKIEDPYEILNETTSRGKLIHKRYKKIRERYKILLNNALETGKISKMMFLFISPSGKDSFTGELAQDLKYKYKEKVVIVGREKSGDIMFSIRSTNIPVKDIVEKVIQEVEGRGGGHEFACGGVVKRNDFSKFVRRFEEELKKIQS